MIRVIPWLMVALLLPAFSNKASAQARAVIVAPSSAAPGDLIILDATHSTATAFAWKLIGSDKTYLSVENGKKVVFSSGKPGRYTFALIVAAADAASGDRSLSVDIATHDILIGKPPAPQPDIDPDIPPGPIYPAPSARLQQAVAAVRSVARTDVAKAKRLAVAFAEFAAVLKTSPDTIKTTTAFRTAMQRFGAALASRKLQIPGLAAALEQAEDETLGKEAAAIPPGSAVELLSAIAWALGAVEVSR